MVARYHNRTDTRAPTFNDRVLYLGSDGVYHSRKTNEAKLLLKCLCLIGLGLGSIYSLCASKNSECSVSHRLVCREYLALVLLRHRKSRAVLEIILTFIYNHVGSALGELNEIGRSAMNCGHHLS